MRRIVYYVACSIDGFISGPNEDASGFAQEGSGVQQYLEDLKLFDTVIMGRKTYEFGYKYGLKPGGAAYPHMDHYIFSKTLKLDNPDKRVNVCDLDLNIIKELQAKDGTDIYLCGGGAFAGWLLDNKMIDVLKIKLNPLILGDGVRMFENVNRQYKLKLIEKEEFDKGLQFLTYGIEYEK